MIIKPKLTLKKPQNFEIQSLGYDNIKIKEVIHISDTHIPLHLHIDRKVEYLGVFNRVYEYAKNRDGMAIIITGDLLHVKLNIEAETFILARQFLRTLSQIAPTVLIIGNHDFTENNRQRVDTMTAICDGLDVKCLKFTGLYQLGNLLLSFSSLYDNLFIRRKDILDDKGLPVYKLFHGTVLGSINSNGTIN